MSEFTVASGRLEWTFDGHKLVVEPWGANSLRVRATPTSDLSDQAWALLPVDGESQSRASKDEGGGARIVNGSITAVVNVRVKLGF